MESCQIINIKLGPSGGFSEAIAVHNAALERGIPVWCGGMLESGIGRAHNIALSSLEGFTMPGDVSASARYWRVGQLDPHCLEDYRWLARATLRLRLLRNTADDCLRHEDELPLARSLGYTPTGW